MVILVRVVLVVAALVAIGLGLLSCVAFLGAESAIQETAAGAGATAAFAFVIACGVAIGLSYLDELIELLRDINGRDAKTANWYVERLSTLEAYIQQMNEQGYNQAKQPIVMSRGQLTKDHNNDPI